MEFLAAKSQDWGSDCFTLPKPQKNLLLGGKSRRAAWVACHLAHGEPPPGGVAVNRCGALDCINGRHWRWGTFQDALDSREFPSRRGGKNPRAKLDEEDVAILRAVNWERGTYKAITCEYLGISPGTLHAILKGWTWKGVAPYVSKVPPHPGSVIRGSRDEGDAF